MHKICCNMTRNTRNQQVAKLSIKYYIGQLFNRQPKGLHVGQNIPPELSHKSHLHWDDVTAVRYSCSDMSVVRPALPTPELADVSTHRYSLCVSGTPSREYSRKNSHHLSLVESGEFRHHTEWYRPKSGGVSAHCVQQLEWRHVLRHAR